MDKHAHSIGHASVLASALEPCKMFTEEHAQRGTEMSKEPGITGLAQGRPKREPQADQRTEGGVIERLWRPHHARVARPLDDGWRG